MTNLYPSITPMTPYDYLIYVPTSKSQKLCTPIQNQPFLIYALFHFWKSDNL